MRTFGKVLIALAFFFISHEVEAQGSSGNFTVRRTLASSTRTYCRMLGELKNPFGSMIQGTGTITTSGSSTTITNSSTTGFTAIPTPSSTRGSAVMFSLDGGNTFTAYHVTTKTDAQNLVIDTNVNITTAVQWGWFDEYCGTGDTDGFISSLPGDVFTVLYAGGSSTATATIECLGSGLGRLPVQVYPDNSLGAATRSLTAADINNRFSFAISLDARFTACRVGFAGTNPIVSAWVDRAK